MRFDRARLPGSHSPAEVVLRARDDPRPFALVGEWAGRGALVGSAPVRVGAPEEDPFALLDAVPPLEGGGVGGGWFGWLGFGLGARLERIAPGPPRPVRLAPHALAFHDHVIRMDAEGAWWWEALVTPERESALAERRRLWQERFAAPAPERRPAQTGPWRAIPGLPGHAAAVAAARERIEAGDLFQANLALRLEAALDGELLDLWTDAVAALRPARAAWFADGEAEIASLSPELFLARRGRRVRSAPIKGTRPRPEGPDAAARMRADLVASPKERAENVMIVDLVRNDLGRVCVPGTIAVAELAAPRPAPGVWHLVSEVTGELRAGVGDAELVRACFPPGSVTGAPKLAALDVIAELESTGREAYTGAMGFASPLAGLELNVAIRTFEATGARVWLQAGGGVVADSDPAAEAEEAMAKARPLLAAIGTDPPRDAERASRRGPGRRGPRPVPRPDPALGVFETLRVEHGVPLHLPDHLARMERSLTELYGLELPADAAARVSAAAGATSGPARLRLDARPERGGVVLAVVTGPLAPPAPVHLRSAVLPGGLGAHKWRDRRWLDAHAVPGEVLLLIDLDGLVLEAARAAVIARAEDGALVTPPADSRILPSTTRARVAARAARLPLTALRGGWIAGALRGLEPIVSLDGVPL